MDYPKQVFHWINDAEAASQGGKFFAKYNPATGKELSQVIQGNAEDASRAIDVAEQAYKAWSSMPVIARSDILRNAVISMMDKREELAEIVALESGKSKKDSLGEVNAAIECGFFYAGEGRRYFGEVLTSALPNRHVELVRQSIGVGVLLTPFNNPSAGVAWKLFPALLCGNTVVIKSHEYTPYIAVWFAKVFKEAGLPAGVISVVQGSGSDVGAPLVEDTRVKLVSLTGSVETGRKILKATAERLAKVSIEAGGKNPFVVCDDADLQKAAAIAASSAFIDGGQRCAAASRIIIFDSVYEEFKKLFLAEVAKLKIGTDDTDNYGAIISERRMEEILGAINTAKKEGGTLLAGGGKISRQGYFIEPTVFENISMEAETSHKELFGPVAVLYRAKNFDDAVELANKSDFKLSGAIHTKSIHRAREFIGRYNAGVIRVNGPTMGSEPHMPFGGIGISGNGWREPGTKALDFYSDWKQISIDHNPLSA